MRKKLFLLVAALVVCGAFLNAQSLDEAILRAALKIGTDLPAGATAAVIHFRSDTEKLSDYALNELHGALLRNRRVTPVKVDERQLQSVRAELRFNAAGDIEGESVRNIGRLMGARYVITGSMALTGSGYEITFTAFDAGNAELRSRYSAAVNPNDPQFAALLGVTPVGAAPVGSRQKPATANVRNNWISLDGEYVPVIGFGVGARYERMLGSRISLGANVFWQPYNSWSLWGSRWSSYENYYEIDASFRWYPWGRTFYLGAALGFASYSGFDSYHYNVNGYDFGYDNPASFYGLAITPEIGWKIDAGKPGGFYLQPGVAAAFLFGEETVTKTIYGFGNSSLYDETKDGFVGGNLRVYFGMGYAF